MTNQSDTKIKNKKLKLVICFYAHENMYYPYSETDDIIAPNNVETFSIEEDKTLKCRIKEFNNNMVYKDENEKSLSVVVPIFLNQENLCQRTEDEIDGRKVIILIPDAPELKAWVLFRVKQALLQITSFTPREIEIKWAFIGHGQREREIILNAEHCFYTENNYAFGYNVVELASTINEFGFRSSVRERCADKFGIDQFSQLEIWESINLLSCYAADSNVIDKWIQEQGDDDDVERSWSKRDGKYHYGAYVYTLSFIRNEIENDTSILARTILKIGKDRFLKKAKGAYGVNILVYEISDDKAFGKGNIIKLQHDPRLKYQVNNYPTDERLKRHNKLKHETVYKKVIYNFK